MGAASLDFSATILRAATFGEPATGLLQECNNSRESRPANAMVCSWEIGMNTEAQPVTKSVRFLETGAALRGMIFDFRDLAPSLLRATVSVVVALLLALQAFSITAPLGRHGQEAASVLSAAACLDKNGNSALASRQSEDDGRSNCCEFGIFCAMMRISPPSTAAVRIDDPSPGTSSLVGYADVDIRCASSIWIDSHPPRGPPRVDGA
jgi:hypothetical protein